VEDTVPELNKIQVIKMLRDLTNCGLREAKIAVDSCDKLPEFTNANDVARNEQAEQRATAVRNIKKQMYPPQAMDLLDKVQRLETELQQKRERIAQLGEENLTLKAELGRLHTEKNRLKDAIELQIRQKPQEPLRDVASLLKRAIVDLTAGRKMDAVEKLLEALAPEAEEVPQKRCEDCDHYDDYESKCMFRGKCFAGEGWTKRIPF
jgi:small-conductance mechanosensitive channel